MAVFDSNKWLQIRNKREALHREMMEKNQSYREISKAFWQQNWGLDRIVQSRSITEMFETDRKLGNREFAARIQRLRSHWPDECQHFGCKEDDQGVQNQLLKMYAAWLVVAVAKDEYEACSEIYHVNGASFNRLNAIATKHNQGHNPEWNVAADTGPSWS